MEVTIKTEGDRRIKKGTIVHYINSFFTVKEADTRWLILQVPGGQAVRAMRKFCSVAKNQGPMT